MARSRRKNKSRPKKRRRPATRRPNRRTNRQSNPQATSGGGLVVKGVRTLVSYLPGNSIFSKIADFGLKAFGFSEADHPKNNVFQGEVYFTGLGGKVLLKYTNILVGSKAGVRQPNTFSNGALHTQWATDYKEARLISLLISVRPIGPESARGGEWTISFAPFYSSDDEQLWKVDKGVPDDVSIRRMPYSVTSAANQPLAIRYRPRPSDGFAFQFHPIDTLFGCLCIRFDDPGRNTHIEFKPSDFSMDCVITGTVEVRQPPTSVQGYTAASDDPYDVLKDTYATVQLTTAPPKVYDISTVNVKCTHTSDITKCVLQGYVIVKK